MHGSSAFASMQPTHLSLPELLQRRRACLELAHRISLKPILKKYESGATIQNNYGWKVSMSVKIDQHHYHHLDISSLVISSLCQDMEALSGSTLLYTSFRLRKFTWKSVPQKIVPPNTAPHRIMCESQEQAASPISPDIGWYHQ